MKVALKIFNPSGMLRCIRQQVAENELLTSFGAAWVRVRLEKRSFATFHTRVDTRDRDVAPPSPGDY